MRHTYALLLCVLAFLCMSTMLVACGARATVTATPAEVGAALNASGCTPTPAVRAPTYTIPSKGQYTPGVVNTSIARYQTAHPGGAIVPSQTVDLDPQIAEDDKYHVVLQLPNCTYETVLVSSARLASYVKNPPQGAIVLGVAPPLSALEAPMQVRMTPRPNQTPGIAYDQNGSPVSATMTPPAVLPSPPSSAFLTAVAHQQETRAASGRGIAPTAPTTPKP